MVYVFGSIGSRRAPLADARAWGRHFQTDLRETVGCCCSKRSRSSSALGLRCERRGQCHASGGGAGKCHASGGGAGAKHCFASRCAGTGHCRNRNSGTGHCQPNRAGVVVAPAAAIATPATAAQPSADSDSSDSPIVTCRCPPAKASKSHERKQRRAHVQRARPLQKEFIVSKAATTEAKARPTVQESGSRKRKRRRKCRW